jgi:integrase
MARKQPRILLAARTQRERRQRRAGIRLRDFSITQKTKERYETAVGRLLPFLEAQEDLTHLDFILCDYIELQWAKGESLYFIADGLSGLHFFWPELRGLLRNAWRMFKCWRKIEAPAGAAPLTVLLARAIVSRAVQLQDIPFACMVALGFHALMRTGELLNVQYKDLEVSSTCGIISLPKSKSGLRSGAKEAIALRDHLTLQLLHTWKAVYAPCLGDKLWLQSPQRFRDKFRQYLEFFKVSHFDFKPYSLRRGGATFLLQQGLPLEAIILKGRWHSLAVARLYLEDGLSMIPSIRLPPFDQQRIDKFAQETPKTAFCP